jgi:hypothetical protein
MTPVRLVGGEWINYNPAECPMCQEDGAFTFVEEDEVVVERQKT